MVRRSIAVCALVVATLGAIAAQAEELPTWSAKQSQLKLLDKPFKKYNVSIRPPIGFLAAADTNRPELIKIGAAGLTWLKPREDGTKAVLMVALTPFKQPSSENLTVTIDAIREKTAKSYTDYKPGRVNRGLLNGDEVAAWRFTGFTRDVPILGYCFVGIDEQGTYAATGVIPGEGDPSELTKQLNAAMLTIKRP